jgi:calcineurin-like phosphoesterase family protein
MKDRAIFVTADLHFGHENIIGYSNRPHGSVDDMNRALVDLWNDTVDVDDEVLVLGDVVLGSFATSLRFIAELNGVKTLVPGNHDRCWAGHGARAAAKRDDYFDAGFDAIVDVHPALVLAGELAIVSHFPYRGDSHDQDRYVEARPADHGHWLLHGHVHERWRQRGRMINVGVDAWAGRPVSVERLADLVRCGEADLAPLPWDVDEERRT